MLELVSKEECSSIENCGTRKLDRKDRLKLSFEKKLKCRNNFKSEIKTVCGNKGQHNICIDPKMGITRIKKMKYDKINHYWSCRFSSKDTKEFDNLLYYCLNKDGGLERKYIIPRFDIKSNHFVITKDLSKKRWYDKYIVKNEE